MDWWKSSAQKQLELSREIVERLEKVERRMNALELDWENMYDKLRSMVQRITKRAEVIEKAQDKEPDTPEETPAEVPRGRLTPHQMSVQQQILRRRSGIGIRSRFNGEEQ